MTAVVPIHVTQSGSSDSSDDDNGDGEDVRKVQSKWRSNRESDSGEQGGNVDINVGTVQDEFLNRIQNLRNHLMDMKVTPVSVSVNTSLEARNHQQDYICILLQDYLYPGLLQ